MINKKTTYVEKIILLLILSICLLSVFSLALLIIVNKSFSINAIIRIIISMLLLIIPIICILLIKRIAVNPLNQYKIKAQKFIQGQIYSEFISETSNIYPGNEDILKHVDKLLNDKQLSMEKRRKSEFLALQNQINPHFLYNTLEAIRGDALSEGMDYIANITEALSTFFRYSVTDTGSLVTISDELNNIDNYFKIQQYRFGENLELIYEIPENEDILDLMCPKLTLQPIVENAIFHGLEKRVEKGIIRIKLEHTEDKLIIIITDNGVGMDNSTLSNLNKKLKQNIIAYNVNEDKSKKGGIALINVCRRIKLLFGENYGIHVFSIPELGTDVRITLPIVRKNMEKDYEKGINFN